MWGLVSHSTGGKQTEGVWEQGAEQNILTKEEDCENWGEQLPYQIKLGCVNREEPSPSGHVV